MGGGEKRERGGCDDEESGAGEGGLNEERELERLLRPNTDSSSLRERTAPHGLARQHPGRVVGSGGRAECVAVSG